MRGLVLPRGFIGMPWGADKAISGGIDWNSGEMGCSTKIELPVPIYDAVHHRCGSGIVLASIQWKLN